MNAQKCTVKLTERQAIPSPEDLVEAARRCALVGEVLARELSREGDGLRRRLGLSLSPDILASMAREAAHHGRIVLQVIERFCRRCSEPLLSSADKTSGYCDLCRAERVLARLDWPAIVMGGKAGGHDREN